MFDDVLIMCDGVYDVIFMIMCSLLCHVSRSICRAGMPNDNFYG